MALLLVEGGGSRSSWYLLSDGEVVDQYHGDGINCASLTQRQVAKKESELCAAADEAVTYLAGYDGAVASHEVIQQLVTVDALTCYSDLDAAWHAFDRQDGIYCLLGTGSQSFLARGGQLTVGKPSLGYLLSDEGSGYQMGAELLRRYFYGLLPLSTQSLLRSNYQLDRGEVLKCLYRQGGPAAYVASFARVLSEYCDEAWAEDIIKTQLGAFVELRVQCFVEHQSLPVYAVGGIAAAFEPMLREVIQGRGYALTQVVRSPVELLAEHYLR